jgi:hypothetical protein
LYLTNSIKVYGAWLITGTKPTREAVESAIIEQRSEKEALVEL